MSAETPAAAEPARRTRLVGIVGVECLKVVGLRRAQALLTVAAVGPFVFILGIDAQQNLPKDTLFGRYVHDSGFAASLLILGFAGQWLLPALVSLVAGDIFSGEDRNGTWKALLTRSVTVRQVFWAKALAAGLWALAATTAFALASVAAGLVVVGDQPLVGLSGQTLGASHAFGLVLLAWASILPTALAFTGLSLLSSAAGRSSLVGVAAPAVLALAMELLSLLDSSSGFQTGLLTTSFVSWHALFTLPGGGGTVLGGVAVSAVWGLLGLAGAYACVVRREFRG